MNLVYFLSFCLLSVTQVWPQLMLAIVGIYFILLTLSDRSDCMKDVSVL